MKNGGRNLTARSTRTLRHEAAQRRLPRTLYAMNHKVVFVDIDGTLVRSSGTKRIPMPSVIAHVRELHASGAILYLWSSGGAVYAETTAKELGLQECFVGFLPKPTTYIDDQPVHEWKYCEHLYPSQT